MEKKIRWMGDHIFRIGSGGEATADVEPMFMQIIGRQDKIDSTNRTKASERKQLTSWQKSSKERKNN